MKKLFPFSLLFKKNKTHYNIDPELRSLKRIGVPMNLFEVHKVQQALSRRDRRETSSANMVVSRIRVPSKSSEKEFLTTLVYEPAFSVEKVLPCVLLLHGGAFLFPAMPYHYRMARLFVLNVGCRVIMPMYDLAPKVVPPKQQEQCYEVYEHILGKFKNFRIDKNKIAVVGDSAGGTLAAALSLMARDRGIQMPCGQALLYPSLDTRLTSNSMLKYRDVPVCNADSIEVYYKLCRSQEAHEDPSINNEYLGPVEAVSLKGMPRTYVETAEFDALHDDGVHYARRLHELGIPVQLNRTKGTVHAFDMAYKSHAYARAMKKRTIFLRTLFWE